jgi:hypothetical protein
MKLVFVAAAVAAALVTAAGSPAAPPKQQQPDPFAGTRPAAATVAKLTPSEAKKLGVPDAYLPGTRSPALPAATAAGVIPSPSAATPCGLCINTCWVTTFHNGSNTTTGSYWENDNPVWCGNGSWITYADITRHWQSVSIWYSADGEAGPWFDGGCVGCSSIHFTLYGYFTWHPPFGYPPSHSTVRLGVWMQAYGGAAYA